MIFKGKSIVKGYFKGEAIVSRQPISFLGGVDPESGIITEKGHELKGLSLSKKVLIIPHGKGSTVGSYVIYSLAKRGLAPGAIVTTSLDVMILTGCVISNIPLISNVTEEIFSHVRNGSIIEVDGSKGLIRLLR